MIINLKDCKPDEKFGVITGMLKAAWDRQQRWLSLIIGASTFGGVYSESFKQFILNVIGNYWFLLIPLWLIFICFDMFVLLPGEQVFYSKSNRLFMEMHEGIKTNGQKASINHKP